MPSKSNLTAALAVLLLAAACEKGPLPGLSSDRLGVVRCPGDDSLQRRRVNTSPEDGYRDRIDSSDFREWQYRVTEGGIVSEPVAETTPVDDITVVVSPNYSENERGIVVEMSDADAEGEWSRIIETEPDICYENFTAKSSRSKRAGPFEGGA